MVTATTPITPGLYFVQVAGTGSVPVSHLPYRLTLLQVDSRSDLVAGTVGQSGRTYDFGSFAINLAPGASTEIQATALASLTVPGGYYLRRRLSNARGQVLAESLSTFFLSDSPLALTLGTDQPAYKPDQTVTVSGQVRNTGAAPIGPETLTLVRNGVGFYTQTVSLAAGGVHDFSAVTTAPQATGAFTLTGQVSDTVVVAVVDAVTPTLDLVLDAPEVMLPGTASADLRLANVGEVPVALDVDFHGQAHTAALEPGQLTVLSRTLALTQTTTISVAISGDVTTTLTHEVEVSAAPTLTLSPEDPQHEGDVVIPYQVVNPGTADLVAEVVFDLAEAQPWALVRSEPRSESGVASDGTPLRYVPDYKLPALQRQGVAWLPPQQSAIQNPKSEIRNPKSEIVLTRTHTLPAGDTVTDTLVVSLTRGLQPVEAVLRADEAHNPGLFSYSVDRVWEETEAVTLSVRGDNDLRVVASGTPTATVVITNVGWNAFTGTLRAVGQRDETFSSLEQPIHVPTDSTRIFTATVDTTDLAPGPYTVTLQVWAENGVLVQSTAITGSVPAPDFVVTQVPAQTTLFSDQVVTLTFDVENRGQAPDLAALHFTLGDLKDETQKQWLAAGATSLFTYTAYLPLDMPTMDILATYAVTSTHDPTGDRGNLLFHVAGISLTVQASTDRPNYLEGNPFTVTLAITNTGARDTGDLTALVAFNGITRTQAFSLTPGAQVVATFPYMATFLGDRKVFYGIYGDRSDRGAYLNTLYLYRENLGASLQLGREVYLPGRTAQATLVTTLTQGTLTAYVFGETYTLTIGSEAGFAFTVPADAERGSQALYYVVHGSGTAADGREQAVWFDVAAPWVRVIESDLGEGPYLPGGVMSATLTVAADAAQDVETQSWIRYPDGSEGQTYRQTVHLDASLNNQVVVTAVVTDTQMGLHQLLYRLVPVVQLARMRAAQAQEEEGTPQADGSESFDVGPAGLDRVVTEQASYPDATDPVQALLDIYSGEGGPAQVTLILDDGPVTRTVQALTLVEGYQTVTVTLNGPILPGSRALGAIVEMGDREGRPYWTARQTTFEYGTSLPDLRGAPPSLLIGLGTLTLQAGVFNEGQAAAPETSLAFYVGTPVTGTLIGTVPMSALDRGDDAFPSLAWDVHPQVEPILISVRADVDGLVTEFDEVNNDSQALITLPRTCKEDVDLDWEVTVADIQMVAAGWRGSNLDLDVDGDGDVDIVDIQKVIVRWGSDCL